MKIKTDRLKLLEDCLNIIITQLHMGFNIEINRFKKYFKLKYSLKIKK